MSIQCICLHYFPIKGPNNIGDHSKECKLVLEKKTNKKVALQKEKDQEMKLYKSGRPPCMCMAKYEETRVAFGINASLQKVSGPKNVYIDFPNFPTMEELEARKFWLFLISLNSQHTQFKIYMKTLNKKHFISTLYSVTMSQTFLDKITIFVVQSDKAPVSRDDILMLKHISLETDHVVIPIRDSGEKYRDLGYHLEGKHTDQCRAKERFGGKKPFKWATYKLVINTDTIDPVKIANHTCRPLNLVITGFASKISFTPFN